MRIRTLKLRDAHCKPGADSSFCSILWDHKALNIVTASSADPAISVHNSLLPSEPPRIIHHHKNGVSALALSPNSTCLVSGSIDRSVKLLKFPGGEMETNITRFTLPLRTLAFNKSGTMLAAAGDDDGIKLIYTIDGTIARVLKGHKASISTVAFDPLCEYLASLDSSGTAIIWELQSGRIIHTLENKAPAISSHTFVVNPLAWSPDGEMLAIPGAKNDVVMYDRDTAELLFSLKGDHSQPICYVSWSPNGKYIATSSIDKQVLIWDVTKKQDIDRQKFESIITSMAWKPIGNSLAIIDANGKYAVWDFVIPSSMKPPTEDIPNANLNSNGVVFEDEELDSLSDDSVDESEPLRKKHRMEMVSDDESDEERKPKSIPLPPKRNKIDKPRNENSFMKSNLQEPFQPGATLPQTGKRFFLCYNMIGAITALEYEGYSHIEIDFHDTGVGPRIPSMTDYFGFTIAALNESGCVFANSCKGDKNMCTLMYRPFSSWASNSEWSMRFEREEVKVVALGAGWVAAATDLNFLRIYTQGGLQKNILSLDGSIVTASGFQNLLAVVTHASDFVSNEQMLRIKVYNISEETQTYCGWLPLTRGAKLEWFGFSEEGKLASYDSKGYLRMLTNQYGGSWLPIFGGREKKEEHHWVAGLNKAHIFCIACKSPDVVPQVMPKPTLTLVEPSFPVASSDLGDYDNENEFLVNSMRLSQASVIERAGIEAKQDVCMLKLIASCCKGDKLVRAEELVRMMSMSKSVRGAINLVTRLKLPNLAERLYTILEDMLVYEESPTTPLPPHSNSSLPAVAPANADATSTHANSLRTPLPAANSNTTPLPATNSETTPLPATNSETTPHPPANFETTPRPAFPQTTPLSDKLGLAKNKGLGKRQLDQESEIKIERPSNPFKKK